MPDPTPDPGAVKAAEVIWGRYIGADSEIIPDIAQCIEKETNLRAMRLQLTEAREYLDSVHIVYFKELTSKGVNDICELVGRIDSALAVPKAAETEKPTEKGKVQDG